MMIRFSLALGLLLTWTGPVVAQDGAQNAAPSGESFAAPASTDWLFVQTSDAMTFDGRRVTLQNIAPRTTMFSDRPQRMAGDIATTVLIDDWSAGENSFGDDPPNASLTVLTGAGEQEAVVELTNPQVNGTSVSYDVNVLEGSVPRVGGTTTLFIDAWRAPLGGRCHNTRWGGVRCNWGPGPVRPWGCYR